MFPVQLNVQSFSKELALDDVEHFLSLALVSRDSEDVVEERNNRKSLDRQMFVDLSKGNFPNLNVTGSG